MNLKKLKSHLDRLYSTFDESYLSSDPLVFVHDYKKPVDQEIVGLLASSLAYGRVDTIKKSITKILALMGPSPSEFVMSLDPKKEQKRFASFKHRFNDGRDVLCLLYIMRQMIERGGSIGGFFMVGYNKSDENIKTALTSFTSRALALDSAGLYRTKKIPAKASVRFFFPSPESGSACKRLNLYLRWMIRRGDKVDLGLWKDASPSKLIIPLDTHIARISQLIGLTFKKNPGWAMAEEVTNALKELDPTDPVKYDFAICRLGILEECTTKKDPAKCRRCRIKGICIAR
jgi:uncharacterized protein (TIGR02757 family)